MIWCFGFFLWLLCDFDEESQQRCEMLRMMTMVTKTVQRPDTRHGSSHVPYKQLAVGILPTNPPPTNTTVNIQDRLGAQLYNLT